MRVIAEMRGAPSPRRGARPNSEEQGRASALPATERREARWLPVVRAQIPTDRIDFASTDTVPAFSPAMFSRESDTM